MATLDPSIILQAGRGVVPLKDPSEIADEQAARQMRQLQMQNAQQGMADEQAYRQVLQSGVQGQDQITALQRAGLGKQSMEAQKFQTDQQKAGREAEKAKIEAGLKHFEAVGQIMAGVKDQSTYDVARQQAAQLFGPEAAAKLDPIYNPDTVARNQQQALSVKDQLSQKWKEMEYSTPNANALLSAQTSRRGQDMADTRAQQANALKAQGNAAGRVPSGYRVGPDGQSLEFIPGGPADPNTKPAGGKPLNDTQAKALQFGSRMQASGEIIDKLAADGVNASVPGARSGYGIGAAISALQPADRQQLDQAKRDFINAVLRRESGAAIAASEFDSAEKQYFAQPGDSAAVIAQKKANRELATRGILEEVPDSASRVQRVRGTGGEAPAAKPAGPQAKTKPINVGGKDYMAELAPDGKYYVQQNGKWAEVR